MKTQLPFTRDLVLVGGGHTHALVLRKWGMNPLPGVRVTVINPGPTAPYSGMLPGFVAGHYSRDDLDIDLVQLARFAGARVILGSVTGIDLNTREIKVPGRPPIGFDVAAIDVGITSEMPDLVGFATHGIPAKPLGVFASRWQAYRVSASNPHIAIIGGGVAGAELATAMAFALRSDGKNPVVNLIDRGTALGVLGVEAQTQMRSALAAQNVQLIENAEIDEIIQDGVKLADGQFIRSDFTTGAAGATPHDWLRDTGLVLEDGFVAVSPTLKTSDPAVFAVGDCAHMSASPRPKAGVYAVRQAPVLFDNLRGELSGGKSRAYQPQSDYLKLISLGQKSALVERFGIVRSGALLWKWKNRIDRKFMDQFQNLPQMPKLKIPLNVALGMSDAMGDKPMCGGCGAKVGRGALRDVIDGLPKTERDDVQSVIGDDAAILLTGDARQVMTTDHLRAFTNDPVMMTRIAAIHALGDIWAMGAAPQVATASIILPRMTPDLQRRTLAEIMTVATEEFGRAGAAIVGGHSSLGDELTIGFTVTGLCDADPITIGGAKVGDVLVLTKPIGSGVIMAAEMMGVAKGEDVAAAYKWMQQPQGTEAGLLKKAHAMTDVTGFGLAGHLAGICEASGVAARLDMAAVPLMGGAKALASDGMRSSLFEDNRAGAGPVFGAQGALGDLLFDPQTAGGLLAAIAPKDVPDGMTIIGEIVAGTPQITVV